MGRLLREAERKECEGDLRGEEGGENEDDAEGTEMLG